MKVSNAKTLMVWGIVVGVYAVLGTLFPVSAATPTLTAAPARNSASIAKYSKFELTFSISKTFASDSLLPYYYYDANDTPTNDNYPGRTSPYGVDGITINTIFTSPSGKVLTVPSFYYQDYTRTRSGSYEVLNVVNAPSVWKTRFTPSEVGTYQYHITVQDKEGTTRYPTSGELSFTSTQSSSKGFIRVSKRDPRFMDYENGSSFVPISGQAQWWVCCTLKSYYYDDTFAQFKQNGVNLVRIWDENDGYALSLESPYTSNLNDTQAIAAPKGTNIDQADAYREDKIIESAEANGVAIELSSHGDVYWTWDASIYTEGWNPYPVNMSNKYHVNYWKRNFRYRVARFGYSTSILAWETWNEHGHITPTSDVYAFYQTYAAYERETDPYDHLLTTSQGSQAYSPGFWSSAANDIANYHDYMMISRYSASLTYDEANFVYRFAQCLRYTSGSGCSLGIGDGSTWTGGPKPWIWGEIGVLLDWTTEDPDSKTTEAEVRERLNEMWAGLFSPIGSAPVQWNGMDSTATTRVLRGNKVASDFFAGVDYNAQKFDHVPTPDVTVPNYTGDKLTSSNSTLRAFVLRSNDKRTILMWGQNKNYTWKNYATTPAAASGNITIPNVPSGTYTVEYWNTEDGTKTSGSNVTANGSLTVPLNNLQKSVAVKIISTSAANPACSADINQDTIVDLTDYSIMATNFFQTATSGNRSDINKDGFIDLTDYSFLAASFFNTCSN